MAAAAGDCCCGPAPPYLHLRGWQHSKSHSTAIFPRAQTVLTVPSLCKRRARIGTQSDRESARQKPFSPDIRCPVSSYAKPFQEQPGWLDSTADISRAATSTCYSPPRRAPPAPKGSPPANTMQATCVYVVSM